jgi:hypothetical protein
MTKSLPFTKAGLKRAILAAQAAGLRIAEIRPDGTIVMNNENNPLAGDLASQHDVDALRRWGDDE